MTFKTAHVPAPDITVDAVGTARSAQFGDVYFSALGGAAETEHVFLRGNRLPERWQGCAHFTIGELGFGTGLNFLVAWQQFLETNAAGHLHYLAIEKYPLTPEQLQTLPRGNLQQLADQLLAQYPLRTPGLHRIHFDRVTLTLGFGDVEEVLPQLEASVDAWFLDGFAPAKNDAMWSDAVFAQLARLSANKSTLATFTVAGDVRRGLQAHGFVVEKVKGFAHKREMLIGHRHCEEHRDAAIHLSADGKAGLPRFARNDVVIVGAGIAGATAARALAERGMAVTVLEAGQVAQGASGNAAAVLFPQLTKYYTPATDWHLSGYGFTLRQLARWKADGLEFAHAQPGMLKIGKDEADDVRHRAIRASLQLDPAIARWVERDEASALVGVPVARGGFWFAQGTWLAPAQLCQALLQHSLITVHEQSPVQTCARAADEWRVTLNEGTQHTAAHLIIAAAGEAQQLLPHWQATLGLSAGQVSLVPSVLPLTGILCAKGYAIAQPGGLLVGATYDRSDSSGAVTQANHATNREALQAALATELPPCAAISGRTSMRATTPSRLPYVGMLEEGLWLSVGHGSRGMISAPLAAELIASEICGEPLPVTRAARAALSPRRSEASASSQILHG